MAVRAHQLAFVDLVEHALATAATGQDGELALTWGDRGDGPLHRRV